MAAVKSTYYCAWTPIGTIDAGYCNHANFAFFQTDASGRIYTNYEGMVQPFLNLKRRNSSIKLFASIGGWNAGTAAFSAMASSRSSRLNFIRNALDLIDRGFDGIDIDWEYPTQPGNDGGGQPNDRANFVTLLSELYSELNSKRKYLSIAVCGGRWTSDQAYDIPRIANYVDYVNIMSYDYQWPYTTTGHNASFDAVQSSAQYWINNGCPAKKIVLGLAAYGYEYNLTSPSKSIGSPASGATAISYRDILTKINSGWNTGRDSSQRVPYIYSGNKWISYDDPQSIASKLQIVSSKGLGGYFIWSSCQDDYDNSGGTGSFPLHKKAWNEI